MNGEYSMDYVYVLGMLECSFGEWSIYGIYSEIEKLKDDYMYLLTSEDNSDTLLPVSGETPDLCAKISIK